MSWGEILYETLIECLKNKKADKVGTKGHPLCLEKGDGNKNAFQNNISLNAYKDLDMLYG